MRVVRFQLRQLCSQLKNSAKIQILFEDKHVIVVNKHQGIAVQPDISNEYNILDEVKSYVKYKESKPGNVYIGLVHRLDKSTSGAIILAKNSKSAGRLQDQFRQNVVIKKYMCMVHGSLSRLESDLIHYIENRRESQSMSPARVRDIIHEADGTVTAAPQGYAIATLQFKCVDAWHSTRVAGAVSLLEVTLGTGRKHQIRAQMAHIGHPIVGDVLYGSPRLLSNGKSSATGASGPFVALHSASLTFQHPVLKTEVS